MDDLISRQVAIDTVFGRSHDIIKQRLKNLPPAQPEREKGKWNTFFSDSYIVHKIGVECSCCGYRTQERTNYCPRCGADMRGNE